MLEVALCFGWIDGQRRPLDGEYFLQRFTPRRARSRWSRANRDWATRLIEAGAMREPGLREVERAQADGRWDAAYDGQRTAEVPDDLRRALDENEPRRGFFADARRAKTATRSSTASTMRSAPRPAPAGSRSSSRCSRAARRSTRSRERRA